MRTRTSYRIGEVATASGVSVEALRFYEREGLLPRPTRSTHGARRYTSETIARVRFIKQAQGVGLKLRDVQILLDSRRSTSGSACRKVRALLAERIADLEQRVEEMKGFTTVLREHLEACDRALARRAEAACPTLDAIERGAPSGNEAWS
ncbi:MAG TPA: MerR family transcriptional regulator [Vicinamibacterales bacterium]|nr:MerR family transcriptional regulator [Vicinamibacterales bacterium]